MNKPDQHTEHNPVRNPAHYCAGKVECIEGIESAVDGLTGFEGFCTGNAIKYLWRWKRKGGVEDLDKAGWYLNRLREANVLPKGGSAE